MKKLTIIALILSLCSCEQRAANQKRHDVERKARLRKKQAAEDAYNVQRFSTLPTCESYWSPDWTKVFYDEKQGYCILRPQPKEEKSKKSKK